MIKISEHNFSSRDKHTNVLLYPETMVATWAKFGTMYLMLDLLEKSEFEKRLFK